MAGDIIHLFPEVVHQYASGWRKVEWVAYVIISLVSYDNFAYYVRVVRFECCWRTVAQYQPIHYYTSIPRSARFARHFLTRRVHFLARAVD